MTQHLINTLRKSIVGAFLFLLPVKPSNIREPEPVRKPLRPDADTWLFDAPRSVEAHANSYFGAMDQLSEALSDLGQLLTPRTEPASKPHSKLLPVSAIWSDTLLFDGEPSIIARAPMALEGHADFLFEVSEPCVSYEHTVAASQVSISWPNHLVRKLAA